MDDQCFVLMPFGVKEEPATGRKIDFEAVYAEAICPAIVKAEMKPFRGDQELDSGIIHEQVFARLLLSPFAVADLTARNANVYYEFGVRHAVKPRTTIAVSGNPDDLAFDVGPVRTHTYPLNKEGQLDRDTLPAFHDLLAQALMRARTRGRPEDDPDVHETADSPLFRLIRGFSVTIPDLPHMSADAFPSFVRDQSEKSVRIASIRERAVGGYRAEGFDPLAELDAVRDALLSETHPRVATATELFLAYRALSAWDRMVALYEDARFPDILRNQRMPREQYAMALNRVGEKTGDPARVARALEILEGLEGKHGPNPETSGLIGRVHKARWKAEYEAGDPTAPIHLERAIEAYRRGFEADHRDYYPGVNLVTLLSINGADGKDELEGTVPVVRYAAERRLAGRDGDYWDHATLLELAVLARDERAARRHLPNALARIKEHFQPKTTADNLTMIIDTAPDREAIAFAVPVRDALLDRSRSA